ncbi:hypothetical protein HRbin26_01590 [bacterium HR26]|nr:hypothetical protein HRbin26_01590 [bacterium HR26]
MPFYGDLEDFPLHAILQGITSTAKSGRLTLGTSSDEITLVFDRGRVAAVTASDGRLRLGRVLVEQGYVSEEQLEQALALQMVSPAPVRLGDLLIELGFVTRQQVKLALAAQLEESLFRILVKPIGSFAFISETPPTAPDETILDETPLEPLVLNAIRRADEWIASRGRREVIALADEVTNPAVLDTLTRVERAVLLALINGATTAHDLLVETGHPLPEIDAALAKLSRLGLIKITEES